MTKPAILKNPFVNRVVGSGEESPEQLLANPGNFRIHPDFQQQSLAGSIDSIGYIDPVLVNKRTDTIIDGHLRVQLALRSGVKMIPVTYVDLSEDEEKLALLSLDPIAALAATDRNKLDELLHQVNSDDERVQEMLAEIAEREHLQYGEPPPEAPEPQIDRAEELRVKWGVETGQLWEIGRHRIICGDCTDRAVVEQVMGGEMANLLWTDPPYHVGKEFEGGYNEGVIWDDKFQQAWQDVAIQFINSGHQRYVCFAQAQSTNAILFYKPNRLLVWCKPFALMRSNSWDLAYEFVSWSYDGDKPQYFDKPDGTKSFDWQEIASVIHGQEGHHHITQKPIALPELHINASCPPSGIVLDVFLGSGTTLVACERLNRIGRGIEISPAYVAVSLQRLADMGLEPKLIDTERIQRDG